MGSNSGYGGCGWKREKERMRVIKLQHFMGFNIYIYIYYGFNLILAC